MNKETYDKKVQELTEDRKGVSSSKRKDYTRGNEDVLKNFKNQAEYMGITPLQSLGVHMEKQFAAVMNYIKTDGKSESEPIIRRIGDVMNYLELLWGLLHDLEYLDDEKDNVDWEDEYVYTNGILDAIENKEFDYWRISDNWLQEQEKAVQEYMDKWWDHMSQRSVYENKSTLEDKKTSELMSDNTHIKEHGKIDLDKIFSYKPEDNYFSFHSYLEDKNFHGKIIKDSDEEFLLKTKKEIKDGDYITLTFKRNNCYDTFIFRCDEHKHKTFGFEDKCYSLEIIAFREEK